MSLFILHHDPYMLEDLQRWAAEAAQRLSCDVSGRLDLAGAAKDIEGKPPHLLVIDTGLRGGEPRGWLALAKTVRTRWPSVPICVVSASKVDAQLSQVVRELEPAIAVEEGSDLESSYVAALRRLTAHLVPAAPAAPPKTALQDARAHHARYDIGFRLYEDGNCIYEVRSNNTVPQYNNLIRFGVPPERLRALRMDSDALPGGDWIGTYRRIGSELVKLLVLEQVPIAQDLAYIEGMCQVTNSRVGLCFTVDKANYPIALESMPNPRRNGTGYWLQYAPLWRQLANLPLSTSPVFSDDGMPEGPVDFLLIDANCEGSVPSLDLSVTRVSGVVDEIRTVLQTLKCQPATRVGRIGHIRVENGQVCTTVWPDDRNPVDGEHEGLPFEDVLRSLLTKGEPWDVVHFAGHSHSVTRGGEDYGYVLLPRTPSDARPVPRPVALGVPRLADWLKRSRFVYLSSCNSSTRDFVFNLCAHQVPAMSGFRWKVQDELAWEHSAHFYKLLLEHRSIEDASQETWLAMFGDHGMDPVWASSQFVIQRAA